MSIVVFAFVAVKTAEFKAAETARQRAQEEVARLKEIHMRENTVDTETALLIAHVEACHLRAVVDLMTPQNEETYEYTVAVPAGDFETAAEIVKNAFGHGPARHVFVFPPQNTCNAVDLDEAVADLEMQEETREEEERLEWREPQEPREPIVIDA